VALIINDSGWHRRRGRHRHQQPSRNPNVAFGSRRTVVAIPET
jgi:hypothetical protein